MKNTLKFTGVITHISEVVSGVSKAGKAYTTQFMVVTENEGQYPNSMKFEFFNKEAVQNGVGETVTIEYNCRVNDKFYQSISAWKVASEQNTPAPTPTAAPAKPAIEPEAETDELPF